MKVTESPTSDGVDHAPAGMLRAVLDAVGPSMLRIATAPSGTDVRIRRTVIHDPIDPLPDGADALLLLVGVAADGSGTVETIRQAAAAGYPAAVVKRRGADLTALTTAASAGGLALLTVSDDASWRQVDTLVTSALGTGGTGGAAAEGTGEELFALANAIAAVIGGSVAVEDLEQRVLAYSSLPGQHIDELRRRGILDRRVPDQPEQLQQYRRVLAAPDVVRLPVLADGELPRAAVAIRAGDLCLGTIWAIEGDGALDPAGERALLDGARLAALHMLRRRSAAELDLQAREQALLRALEGTGAAEDLPFRLGLPDRPGLTLLGFAPVRDPEGPTPLLARIGSAVARHWAAVRPEAAVATTSHAVYVLLPAGAPDTARRLAAQTAAAVGRGLGLPLHAALSRPAADVSGLPALRAEVDDVLRVTIGTPGAPAVAALADVHAQVLLALLADTLARRPELRHPAIDAMVEHDRAKHTHYAASVTAWLDAVGDIASAAQRLNVHPNTVKYRLRRAQELFGLDLAHPDERLSSWLQLRLARAADHTEATKFEPTSSTLR